MAYVKQVFLIFLLICVSISIWFYTHKVLTGNNYTAEIEKIVFNSKASNIIDLTQFKTDEWDEIAIWYPYSDIRDFKIDGVYLLFDSSHINSNDANNVLLFIKNNKIKGHAVFSRKKVDFANFDLGIQRIVRDKAVFKFNHLVDFSKVQFLNE